MLRVKIQTLKKGFSLVELMVVIAIMAIATGIALKTPTSNKDGQELEAAAREVAQAIRQVQNNALGGKLPNNGDNNTFACGYMIAFGTNANKNYRTGFVNKSTSVTCAANSDADMSSSEVTLKNNVEFDLITDRAVYFSIPRGEVWAANYDNAVPKSPSTKLADASPQAISLKSAVAGSLRADICVYASGKIMELPLRDSSADGTPNC